MSDTDFRIAYDALLEEMPDPPSFEQIRSQTLRTQRRQIPGRMAATVAATAVLLGVGGIALLTGGNPGPGEELDGVEAALVEAVANLGGLCEQSSTTADFDGDGRDDAVAVGFAGCDTQSGPSDPTMVVSWSSGETESWVLEQCGVAQPEGPPRPTGICRVFAAPDLNDDGKAELAVEVQNAAGSTVLLQFYELTPEEATQAPIQVAPGGPGSAEITPGQIATFIYGSSPDYENNMRCTTGEQDEPVVLVTVAESQDGQWSVFDGTWQYDGRFMDFRSQRTYSIPKDSPDAAELVAGVDICGAPIADGQKNVELRDFNMALTYPYDWHLADVSLTPNLASPTEIFSIGSFPLRAGGPNCAQIPSQALHDMAATDVFVTIQERGTDLDTSGFDPRPARFGPISGSTDNVFYDCLGPNERDDVGAIHWIWFTDQDRYFHVLVAIGRDASREDTAAVWEVLDEMEIRPWN
jgi:hypothetical protein